MTAANQVLLKFKGHYDEAVAVAACSPGHLLLMDSAGKVKKHNVYGGRAERIWAYEDANQGRLITDAYSINDVVFFGRCLPGDRIAARIPANAAAIAIGDTLVSNGDGTIVKNTGGNSHTLFSNTVASNAVTNTTTETDFNQKYTIPANFLQPGDVLTINAQVIATATNTTDTLTVKLYIGGTAIVATAAVDVVNNDIAVISATVIIRTIGAAGTYVAFGQQGLGTPGTVTAKPWNLGSTAIDTTATQVVKVTATWSVANAGDSCRLDGLDIELSRSLHLMAVAQEAVDNSAVASESFLDVAVL